MLMITSAYRSDAIIFESNFTKNLFIDSYGIKSKRSHVINIGNDTFYKRINNKEYPDLDKRFNKKGRDFGKLAIEKTKVIERIINGASDKAIRCVEIAGGSPLTAEEIAATKKSEINRECPSIANPNYVPYNN